MWTAVISALAAALMWLVKYFSAESELGRRKVAEAEARGREAVEAERLRATYERIGREAPSADVAEAVKRLNERLGRLGPPGQEP